MQSRGGVSVRCHTESMKTNVYGMSSVQAGAQGRVGVGKVFGVVTSAEARKILMDSPRWGDCRPLAHVADYRQATMAIEPAALLASAVHAQRHGVILAPAALVVGPDQITLFSEYARASNAAGVLKAVFSTLDEALRWAARQALVREHWQARMNELQLTP